MNKAKFENELKKHQELMHKSYEDALGDAKKKAQEIIDRATEQFKEDIYGMTSYLNWGGLIIELEDLSKTNLEGKDFTGVKFWQCKLGGSFKNANFTGAEFYACHFDNECFDCANFEYAVFDKCYLGNVEFLNCNLSNALFSKCDIDPYKFDNNIIDGVRVYDCDDFLEDKHE